MTDSASTDDSVRIYKNHPFEECVRQAAEIILKGGTIYQKFTCAKCESRQTMAIPDRFYKTGRCEECGHITNIFQDGCNYLVIFTSSPTP